MSSESVACPDTNPGWELSDSQGTEGEGDMRTRLFFLVTLVSDSPTVAFSVAV